MLKERGLTAEWIAADASDVDQIQRMASTAIERMGTIDILVNNAGATWGAPAEDYPISAWDKVMNLNVRSAFVLSQYVAKHCMIARRRGRILMTASAAGFGGNPPGMETVAYNTSKAALINLTRALAGEWGEYGITVNALAPGFFPTKMTRGTLESVDLQGFISKVPLRRIGDDEDLKGSVVLLASDAGKHITGETIAIDGGFLAIRA
jgi:gluconate 5-dehydrogenase